MAEKNTDAQSGKIRVIYRHTDRKKRRYFKPVYRIMIISIFGTLVALMSSYLLNKIGL